MFHAMENSIGRFLSANEMTQEEFATQAKVSQPTVSDWVLGNKKPEPERIPSLAKILKTTPQSLLLEFHLHSDR